MTASDRSSRGCSRWGTDCSGEDEFTLCTKNHTLFLVDIHHEGLAAVRLFHVFDVCMLVPGGTAFLKHFHDQVGDDIAGSARTHADEDSCKQRQVISYSLYLPPANGCIRLKE